MIRFIGFGHRRRMGKDEVVQQLVPLLNKATDPSILVFGVAFADPMYEICHKLYGWDGFRLKEEYDGEYAEEKSKVLPTVGKTPRQLLIEIGTPAIKEVMWEHTWTEYLMHRFDHLSKAIILISDLRFPIEAVRIKQEGGLRIKIERPGVEKFDDVADSALSGYPFDATVQNNGPVEALGPAAFEAIKALVPEGDLDTWVKG